MKLYHVAPEDDVSNIYNRGIFPDDKGEILLIVLKENFLMNKFIFDAYAYELLGVDLYCAFEILPGALESPLIDTSVDHVFSDTYKAVKQKCIERKYLRPFKSGESYEGMGLINGVFPVENKEKFTPEYKQRILEYLKEVSG